MSAARLTPDIKLLYNPQMKSAYNFVPGVMGLILMLICAMMTSISIVREKETGTMEVLLVSPVKPLFIILAKAVPYFVLSFVNLITILLLSVFVLDVPVVGSLFWLITVSLLFIFVSLALGLLISSVTRTQVAFHAGFRIDADDAHNAFIGHDFPYREYAGDTSMDLGYTSGTLVYTGCA